MQPKKLNRQLSSLCPNLLDQLNPEYYLLRLGKAILWQVFEENFLPLHAAFG